MKMKNSVRRLVFGFLMLTVSMLAVSAPSSAQIGVGISVRVGPPPLPVYAQPICPGPGYLWTPGYWAWNDDDGYYWVPGTWVVAPVGMLWTPGYWGWGGGFYVWHAGYWGPHVGFYGGINYGFGYGGFGFAGGEWRGRSFFYNRSVTNVNVTNVTNVYNRTVIVNNVHTSFNGPGGIGARPTRQQESFARERHTPALAMQTQHERAASQNRQLFASENHGRPAIAATGRPGEFNGPHVQRAAAAGGAYRAPQMSPREARGQSSAREARGSASNSGGNRGFNQSRNESPRNNGNFNSSRNESPRNNGNLNNREMSRPTNREAGNRGQMARENPRQQQVSQRPDRGAQIRQDRAAQNRGEKPNRAPARSEPRRNERERR
jgi:YXWGXW repeat-containing protein